MATCAICLTGCARGEAPPDRLVARTEHAVAELERLRPRLAKSGTPDAEALAERLNAVRVGLAQLPPALPPPPVPLHAEVAGTGTPLPVAPSVPASVRCPDDGCWRLGLQVEAAQWQVDLAGGGGELHDDGATAVGLALGIEWARPVDAVLEWSWGAELVTMTQQRRDDQHVTLVGIRPFLRAALAITDNLAVTLRPLVECGEASVRLGSEPGGVLDGSAVYGAIGIRAGCRWHVAEGDLTGELGWRRIRFNASAGDIDYRVDISSPEAAIGWGTRF